MFLTVWLIAAILSLACASNDNGTGGYVLIDRQRPSRYQYLYQRCHNYLEQVHYIGRSRIEHNHLEINKDEIQPAVLAAFTAAEPFFDGRTDQAVCKLAERCGFSEVQQRVNNYIAAAAQSSENPKLVDLVRAHRSWRMITNIVTDALALILQRHPTSAAYINHAKIIMYVVGRDVFVLQLLARSNWDQHEQSIHDAGEGDPMLAIRNLRGRGLFQYLESQFEFHFPKVLKERADVGDCFSIIPAMMQGLARVWWSGAIRPQRQRRTFEQFVLGCGLSIAEKVLGQHSLSAPLRHSEMAFDTLEFDQMFDRLLSDLQIALDDRISEDTPFKEHLISMILEIFSDFDRPRYLLEWVSAKDDNRRQEITNLARDDLMASIESRLEAVLV